MIDDKVLDEVLPIPEIEDLAEEKIEELQSAGFKVTNFTNGGIFYTLLMIILHIRIELIKLARILLSSMFVTYATGIWLDLKAVDFSKVRKTAGKTIGHVTLIREDVTEPLKIAKGTIFKTARSIDGEELRYFVLETSTILAGIQEAAILVEAEKAGSEYNVSEGMITRCLIHLEGIESITNKAGWITQEGADEENDEELRLRTLNAWSELALRPIADKYKSVCEAVDGVLSVQVDDQHPRGQGTVDIIVTGTAGEASPALLESVREAAYTIRGEYDNLLIKSSEAIHQNVEVTITMPANTDYKGIEDEAMTVILNILSVRPDRKPLNELLHLDLLYALKDAIPSAKNIKILNPLDDIILENDKVLIAGEVTIRIQEG